LPGADTITGMNPLTRRQLLAAGALAGAGVAVYGTRTEPATAADPDRTVTYRGRQVTASARHATIDGVMLHMHRHGDGTWTSVMNHYEKFPTPFDAAKAAVVALHGAHLRTNWWL
jgi:hypothetical protein